VDLYHRAHEQIGSKPNDLGVHSPGHVAATDEEAREGFFPGYKAMHDLIGGQRGWPPLRREDFDREIVHGSLYIGSPETVAKKIAATAKALGIQRFDLKYSAGPVPHDRLMRCIELYGTRVIPLVRDMLA
jgi:alkanesulfonate monooxygenase SsuD/methylene tetrahydromethanopterin reductase-like flavin-dependent oxidoreductase (luciferase family)